MGKIKIMYIYKSSQLIIYDNNLFISWKMFLYFLEII